MNLERYKTEIELIEKQNNVEHDLYNIIAEVIRERQSFFNVSLRDVSNRQRTKEAKEKVLWGLKGFPDFVIFDKRYEPEQNVDRKYLYGAIEAKFIDKPLFNENDDLKQLWGHLLWFKEIIYTNGIIWEFYKIDDFKIDEITKGKLICLQNESSLKLAKKGIIYRKIDNLLDCVCRNYCIDELRKTEPFVLRDETKVWQEEQWNKLVDYLDNYKFPLSNQR